MTDALLAEIATLHDKIELLEEDLSTRALQIENVGWKLLHGFEEEDDGLSLDTLKDLSEQLREMAATNPWHKRGAQLRHSYIFGKGMTFQGLKPAAEKAVADDHNRETAFSVEAYERNNLALFTDGNLILARNARNNRFQAIPLRQITGVYTDPDDAGVIRYVQRSWSSNGEARNVWYPVARYKREIGRVPARLKSGGTAHPVDQNTVVYIKRANRQDGWTWGVPDSLAAKIYSIAYSGYLGDNSKLFHALAQFAWTITSGSKAGVDRAAAQVSYPGGTGGTGVMGDGQSLASVGVPSAQVNMNNGQPLAAAVATSFGVPVIALLASPGATGGSYGAATTLDSPTLKGFEALQDSWKNFYEEIFRDMASKDASVEFPAIETDPIYRQVTAISTAVELGLIWPDEGRGAVLDILDVPKLHETPPPKPEPTTASAISSQGNSGSVPGGQEQGDTDHDLDSDRE